MKQKDLKFCKNILTSIFNDSSADTLLDKAYAFDLIDYCLDTLLPNERKVIYLRFNDSLTLKEAGKYMNLTQERIRQIQNKALRKLRHPSRSKLLREGLKSKDFYLNKIKEEVDYIQSILNYDKDEDSFIRMLNKLSWVSLNIKGFTGIRKMQIVRDASWQVEKDVWDITIYDLVYLYVIKRYNPNVNRIPSVKETLIEKFKDALNDLYYNFNKNLISMKDFSHEILYHEAEIETCSKLLKVLDCKYIKTKHSIIPK